MNIEEHVIYQLRNAQVRVYPYPHFFVENVFPEDYYEELLNSLEDDDHYVKYSDSYPDRYFGPKEPPKGCEFMASERFMKETLSIFAHWLRKRYPEGGVNIASDTRLIRDHTGYRIGPHTDAPWKLISLLFYLPSNNLWERNGTSIYLPKNRSARCAGGPHYEFEEFDLVYTAPYRRNSCLGFWKTDYSFHGVEPITDRFFRNVLLYNVYDENKIPISNDSGTLGAHSAGSADNGKLESERSE